MEAFIPLAIKSVLFAAGTLLLLRLMRNRSAADRSWIAHLGLAAIAILPLVWLAMPQLEVAASWMEPEPAVQTAASIRQTEAAPAVANFPGALENSSAAAIDWGFWAYAVPAGLLLLLTLIAVVRLVTLKARATVLVEPRWLSALAHAQRRMGFKHGTALLTSDDLRSPISWGLMRPVILLNSEATDAHAEAEAIIAHELAHVARLDWAKLLLSRITVAIFWFNPLVWLLAREAHQLREEAADDAVLAADIDDTDYARLLVGIARHECRGMLLGAHGVAPARNSLSRRVRRVLDGAIARAPGGWRWSSAAAFFAAGMAVPVAALNFVPPADALKDEPQVVQASAPSEPDPYHAASGSADHAASRTEQAAEAAKAASAQAARAASITTDARGTTTIVGAAGETIAMGPADAKGRRKLVLTSPAGRIVTYADANGTVATAIARAVARKAVGADPAYIRAIRRAVPHLRLDDDEIVQMKGLGVTPSYVRELAGSGLPNLGADEIVQARALNIDGSYIRGMMASGLGPLSMDEIVELKAAGATPQDVEAHRRAGRGKPSVDAVVQAAALGIDPEDIDPDNDP